MRQYLGINGPAGISLTAIALVIIVLGLQVPSLLGAILSFGKDDDIVARQMEAYVAKHDRVMQTYEDRFVGRSLFDTPRPTPVITMPTTPVRRDPKPKPTPPAPKPVEPPPSPIAIFGNEVWFKPIRAGESILIVGLNEEKEQLKVLEIDPPMAVKVSYMGNEHDLTLFGEYKEAGNIFTEPEPPDTKIPGEIDLPAPEEPKAESEKTEAATEPPAASADPEAEKKQNEPGDNEDGKKQEQEGNGKDVPPDAPKEKPDADPDGK